MKKTILKFTSVFLALLTGLFAVACSGPKEEETKTNPNHNFSYTETDRYLLEDGATEYKVVVPLSDSLELNYAKTELITLFREATGVTLECVSDEGLSHNAANRYISLGNTALYRTSGLNVNLASLKEDGVRILTKDNTVFLLGGTDSGVLYAVYDFLNLHFGFETYYKDCYTLQKNVKTIRLMDYDVTDIPDIDYRGRASGILYSTTTDYNDVMYSYRLRTVDAYWKRSLPIHVGSDKSSASAADHNCFYYLPTEVYLEEHPDFYSSKNPQGQLCYTAHGNQEEFELMVELCAEKIEQSLTFYPREQYPLYASAQLGIADNYDTCNCAACKAVKEKYNGAIVSTIIIFLKEVGRKVDAWMALPENEPYAREGFQYTFFSYQDTLAAPFSYNESTGEYEAADSAVLPEDVNVVPFLAISWVDHAVSIYDESNKDMVDNLDAWLTYYDNAWTWTYGCFYNDYFAFYDCYNFYSEAYRYFAENKFKMVVPQQHSGQRGADTGFFTMAAYVLAKLAWDSSLDMEDLIDDYMNAVFREAAEPMKEMFTECRLWHAKAHAEGDWSWSYWTIVPTGSAEYWQFGYVNKLFSCLDEAYSRIERYRGDSALYESLRTHIDVEWLYPAMIAINNFESEFSASEFRQICSRFKTICIEQGMTNFGEHALLAPVLAGL